MDMTLDLYVDYLICSTSYTTATGLSKVTGGVISHDKVTRFLSLKDYTAADLWLISKPFYKSIESNDGVIIVDDSIEEKPYTDENEIICWHFDHTKDRSVKGINFITALYQTEIGSMPIGYELVKKTHKYINQKTGKNSRKATISKQQHYRNLIKNAVQNNLRFKYVLNDVWFSSVENMTFVKRKLNKDFIMPVKSNRKVALSEKDKALGRFVGINSLELGESILVWLHGLDFPLRLVRQVFKNEDGSTGVLYLVSSDIELKKHQIETIYQRRWKVETYHQSLKNNASLAKSPTKIMRTQANHFFASLCAYIRLESISIGTKINHFALKQKIYLAAMKTAMEKIREFGSYCFCQTDNLKINPA